MSYNRKAKIRKIGSDPFNSGLYLIRSLFKREHLESEKERQKNSVPNYQYDSIGSDELIYVAIDQQQK